MRIKRLLRLLLTFAVMISMFTTNVMAKDEITVLLNGEKLEFDVPPQLISSRTMVPMRKIFEEMGASVEWDGTTQTVTATKDEIIVVMQIDSNIILVNNREITFDVPPMLIDSRTLVPARAVAESLNALVDWDNTTRTVIITEVNDTSLMPTEDIQAKFEASSDAVTGINYWLFTPQNPTSNMPLIVYLHGGSGKGDDINKLTENGFCKWVSEGNFDDVSAYIMFPQVSSSYKGWSDIKDKLKILIDSTVDKYSIDKSSISLTGHSMGGTGTFDLAMDYPTLFSKIAPMSGSVKNIDKTVQLLKNIPVWAFVGSRDKVVSPEISIQLIEKLKTVNDESKITVFQGADHKTVPELGYLDRTIGVVEWLITK